MDLIAEAYKDMKSKGIPSSKELEPFCSDSECYEYAQAVQKKWPHLNYDSGFYMSKSGPKDHAWTMHPNGTIIDTTAKQFGKGLPMIVPPDHAHHSRYVSWERHETKAQEIAHAKGYHEEDPVDICPHCKGSK